MLIELNHLKPRYMSESELSGSDIYLQPQVLFERGRLYRICARSGHGKTSLLNFIYGASLAYEGTIRYHEAVASPFELRLRKLSYMFQDLALFPELTALENIRLKNDLTHHKSELEIRQMLELLLPVRQDQPLRTLSLGQRQRVAAVRALCQPFEFLLLDEPFSHLDAGTAAAVASLMLGEVRRQGAGMIVTALDPTDLFPFDVTLNL